MTRSILAPVLMLVTGCYLPFLSGGDAPDRAAGPVPVTVKPAALEELVARAREKTRFGHIASAEAPAKLYVPIGGIQRVNPIDDAVTTESDYILMGLDSLGFAGVSEGRVCFVFDKNVEGKGEKKIIRELEEQLTQTPAVVFSVDDLAGLRGPAWPGPQGATALSTAELVNVDLDDHDRRVAVLKVCAPTPQLNGSHRYLVVLQHSSLGERELNFEADPIVYPTTLSLEDEKKRRKFQVDGLHVWELAPGALSNTAGPVAARPEKKAPATAEPTAEPAPSEAPAASKGPISGTLAKATVAPSTKVTVSFAKPLPLTPGERYWVTVVPVSAADTAYTSYEYVEGGARSASIAGPSVGGVYELRLHANYPTKNTNLVFRAKLTVK